MWACHGTGVRLEYLLIPVIFGLAAGVARAIQSPDPRVIETGSAYLRIVGPTYGFFGLGLALYFASQGAARLLWPLLTGFLRVIIAIGGGRLALRLTGSLNWLFAALAFGLIVYGVTLTAAITSGAWFGRERSVNARG